MGLVVKNLPANARDALDPRDGGSIPAMGRYPGVGNGNPLQYSCLENSKDRRAAWWATVHGIVKELDTTSQPNNNLHTIKLTHIKFLKSIYRFVSAPPESKFVLYYFCNIIYKVV